MNSISLTIFSFLSLYYQTLVLNDLSLGYYLPNILISLLIFSHFYLHINYHTVLFFLIGIALDCSNPIMFGFNTFSFLTISYLITLIKNHIDLTVFANKIAMIAVCNIVFYLLYVILASIVYQQTILALLFTFIMSFIINTICSLVIISILDFLRMLKFDPSNE